MNQISTSDKIVFLIIFIVLVIVYFVISRLYWRMRSDNGYNMGRNHMHDLGFSDEDIKHNQDDADKDLYVFRKANEKKGEDKES